MSESKVATKGALEGLRKVVRKDRKNKFGCQWTEGGKRKFRFFRTKEDRDGFFNSHRKVERVEDFSLSEWLRWQDLKSECAEIGLEPEAAIAIARKYAKKASRSSVTLSEATEAYLVKAATIGRSDDYIRHLRSFYARLEASLGADRPLVEIDRNTMQDFFTALDVGAVTQNNYRAYAIALFNNAIGEDWIDSNPMNRVIVAEATRSEPGILTPEQTEAVLRAAQGISDELAALLALQLFAGLRNANVTRLEAQEIDLENKTILIPAAKFKTKSRHLIEDPAPNLWSWLAKVDLHSMCSWTARNYNWRKGQAFKAAEIDPPKNALRHSYASYKCALDGSAEKASYVLGHQNPREIWSSYKGITTRTDAKRFFGIKP